MNRPKGFPPDGAENAASAVTLSGMGDSNGSKKMRSYEEIIAEAKENRNILEIKITRMEICEDGVMKPATNRFDKKEVNLKPGVDPTPYLTKDTHHIFKNHEIEVISQTANVT